MIQNLGYGYGPSQKKDQSQSVPFQLLGKFLYYFLCNYVCSSVRNQRSNLGLWTVGLLNILKKCKGDAKVANGGCKGQCEAGRERDPSSSNLLLNQFQVATSLQLPLHPPSNMLHAQKKMFYNNAKGWLRMKKRRDYNGWKLDLGDICNK